MIFLTIKNIDYSHSLQIPSIILAILMVFVMITSNYYFIKHLRLNDIESEIIKNVINHDVK
jgi:hypothetical protein